MNQTGTSPPNYASLYVKRSDDDDDDDREYDNNSSDTSLGDRSPEKDCCWQLRF